MKKLTISAQTLRQVGNNGNFRLNDKFWLSPIDHANICADMDLDPSTNSQIFNGAIIECHEVVVPQGGITVKNPITQKEVVFKPHNSAEPVVRHIGWRCIRLSETNNALLIGATLVTRKRGVATTIAQPSAAAQQELREEQEFAAQAEEVQAEEPAVAQAEAEAEGDVLP